LNTRFEDILAFVPDGVDVLLLTGFFAIIFDGFVVPGLCIVGINFLIGSGVGSGLVINHMS
jgi:hypothetical protein